jgi:hypothetical protein
MYFEMFAFPFCGWGVFFFKQHFVLSDLEDQGKVVSGRNDVVYWFSMLLALWMNWEVAKSCFEFIVGSTNVLTNLPEKDPRKTNRQQGQRPTLNIKDVVPQHCTVDAIYDEYFLAFQYFHKSCHDMWSQYYNTIWVLRWVFMAVSSILWYKYPRVLYLFFFVINILMVVLTIKIKESIRHKWIWILMVIEELLIFFWHFACLINYIDYYGKRGIDQFWINTTTHLILWGCFFSALIEWILLVAMAFLNRKYFNSLPLPEANKNVPEVKVKSNAEEEISSSRQPIKYSQVGPDLTEPK